MRNLELYGVQKVAQELRNRELHILSIASNGEKAARTMAWKMFCEDELKIDDNNNNLSRLAQIQYFHAVDLLPQYGLSMDVDERKFRDFFLDELWVINKSVTKKGGPVSILCVCGFRSIWTLQDIFLMFATKTLYASRSQHFFSCREKL